MIRLRHFYYVVFYLKLSFNYEGFLQIVAAYMKKRISMTTSIVFGVKKHTNTNKCFININFIISKKII